MNKQLLFLIALLITIVGYSQAFFVQDTNGNMLRYNPTSSNTVSLISGSTINNASVAIHASVTNSGTTYNVTSLGMNCLGSSIVTNVSIPNSITSIEEGAFNNADLNSVVLPNNLQTIGDFAFGGNQLTGLTIPSSVTSIGSGAFRANNGLTSVTVLATVPPTITTASNSSDTFYDTLTQDRSDIDLIIPAGTTGAYVTDTGALWTGFNSVTENLNTGDTYIDAFITYEVTSAATSTVKAVDYNTAGGGVVDIPLTIPNGLITYSVTEIGNGAFQSKGLTSVTIPDSVTIIGSQAFVTNDLTIVTIGNNVTVIGIGAFADNDLTSIIIPSSVNNIGALTFAANPLNSVTSLGTTPATITTGTNDTFDINGDRSNINLQIPSGTSGAYVTDTGALWTGFNSVTEDLEVGDTYVDSFITYQVMSTANNTLEAIDYDEVNAGTAVNIPATVVNGLITYNVISIGTSAFFNKGMTSVILNNGLESIGSSAFLNNQIASIDIPASVNTIGPSAFTSNFITSIVIPDNVINLGNGVFQSNNITTAVFPSNLTSISSNLFTSNNLSTITIPDSVTSIGIGAFQDNQLTSISFGNNVEIIDIGAFADNQLTSIVFPSTLTTIGNVAFRNNQLTTLIFPDTVTDIGLLAFENNPMTDVYSESTTPPTIATGGTTDSFADDRSTIHLHIPPGTMGAYVTDTGALWTGFNPVTEDATLSTSNFELNNDIKVITTTDHIKVIAPNTIRLQNYTLYSITGSKVTTGKKNTIATTTLTTGIYILKLDFDSGTLVKKVVVN